MKKKPLIFLILFVTLLFGFSCTFTLFDEMREADFFSGKKYESQDMEGLYAEKKSNADVVLVSVTFLPFFENTFFEILPSFFSPNIIPVTTSPILRC